VRARGLTKCFGEVVALDGVDLDVVARQVHGVAGPNGAGKTTLLGLLLGLAVADRGSLEILGTPAGWSLAAPNGVAGFADGHLYRLQSSELNHMMSPRRSCG
jgi:ABC-2 type transport system ATP-binding protein